MGSARGQVAVLLLRCLLVAAAGLVYLSLPDIPVERYLAALPYLTLNIPDLILD